MQWTLNIQVKKTHSRNKVNRQLDVYVHKSSGENGGERCNNIEMYVMKFDCGKTIYCWSLGVPNRKCTFFDLILTV